MASRWVFAYNREEVNPSLLKAADRGLNGLLLGIAEAAAQPTNDVPADLAGVPVSSAAGAGWPNG